MKTTSSEDASPFKRLAITLALALVLFGGVALFAARDAWAAGASGPWGVFTKLQGFFGGGLYVGATSYTDTANKVSTINRCTLVNDFPSLGGTGALQPGDTICATSDKTATCSGVVFGDQLSFGIDQAPVNAFGNINCYVSAADAVKCRACATGITDGGSFNMPDASYTITWMH